jgi:hypothetical protein
LARTNRNLAAAVGRPHRPALIGLPVLVAMLLLWGSSPALAEVAVTEPGPNSGAVSEQPPPAPGGGPGGDSGSPTESPPPSSDPPGAGSPPPADPAPPPPDPAASQEPAPPPPDPGPPAPDPSSELLPSPDPAALIEPAVSDPVAQPVTDASLQPLVDSLIPLVDALESVNGSLDSFNMADVSADSSLATLVSSLQSLTDTLDSLVTQLEPAAKAGAPVTSTLQPIVTALNPLIKAVNEALQPLIAAMKPLVEAVTEPLTAALRPLVDALEPLVESLAPLVTGLAPLMAALEVPAQDDVWYIEAGASAGSPVPPAGVAGPLAARQPRKGAAAEAAATAVALQRTGAPTSLGSAPEWAKGRDRSSPYLAASTATKASGARLSNNADGPNSPGESPLPGPALPSLAGAAALASAMTLILGGLAVLLGGLAWTRRPWARRICALPASWRPVPFLSLLEQPG